MKCFFWIFFGICSLLIVAAPVLFPEPFIDLFIILKTSLTEIGSFHNPYETVFTDLYKGQYEYAYGNQSVKLVYWPLNLYLLYPFQLLFGDLRFGYIFYLLLGCIILFLGLGKNFRTLSYSLGLVFINAYTFYMVKYGWIDILAFPFFAVIYIALLQKKYFSAFCLLGFLMALKLYFVILLPLFLLYIWKNKQLEFYKILKLALVSTVCFFAGFLPFIISNFEDILYTIQYFGNSKPRFDSLSIPGLLYFFKFDFSFFFSILTVIFILFFYFLYFRTKNDSLEKLMEFVILILFGIFLFAKQSFGNYYYNIILLVVIYLVFLLTKTNRTVNLFKNGL